MAQPLALIEVDMCGFVAVIGMPQVAPALCQGLAAIQHRGQDAAGLGTIDGSRFHLHKAMGLISHALPPEVVANLTGTAGIAHVRYPTAGATATREDAQPFLTRRPGILLAHNGNVINVPQITAELRSEGWNVLSSCDAEPILLVLTTELNRIRAYGHTSADVVKAVEAVHRRIRGAYSVVALLKVDGQPTLVAFRDRHGIRPGVFGQHADGAWVVASESVSLDVLDVRKTGDLPVGEVLLLREGQAALRLPVGSAQPRPCVFERIYFARADSIMEDGRVNRTRGQLGQQLAREWRAKGHQVDVVVPVPDTSRPAAQAIAEALEVRHREGFIKNCYSGRTFIMPTQATRNAALRLKLNPIREIFEGHRVLLIDDSIVRGNTMRRLVALVRAMNPAAIHLGIISPPVRHPCFYGIDMPSPEELVASQWSPDQVDVGLALALGADSVTYLSRAGLSAVAGDEICAACFDGDYVVPVSDTERSAIHAERRPDPQPRT